MPRRSATAGPEVCTRTLQCHSGPAGSVCEDGVEDTDRVDPGCIWTREVVLPLR